METKSADAARSSEIEVPIDLSDEGSVDYWRKRLKVTRGELEEAVMIAGHNPDSVTKYLHGPQSAQVAG